MVSELQHVKVVANSSRPGFVLGTTHRLGFSSLRGSQVRIPADTNLYQLWQALTLKPFKLEECILYFWKPPNFNNLVPADQDHSCVFNTWKSFLKIAGFGVFMIWFCLTNHSFPFRLYIKVILDRLQMLLMKSPLLATIGVPINWDVYNLILE